MAFEVKRATREGIVPNVVLMGGPGSGKTYSGLRLLTGMGCKNIIVIDTENKRSRYYADDFKFRIIELKAPYSTGRYGGAIASALDQDCDGMMIDQVTYEWSGTGGVLDSVDNSPASNDFVKWKEPRKAHTEFLDLFVHLKIPYVVNVRAKVEWAMEKNDRGKMAPVEKGFEAVQGGRGPREKFEFEFPLVFLVKGNHHSIPVKDMTKLFAVPAKDEEGQLTYDLRDEILTEEHGRELVRWARAGGNGRPAVKQKGLSKR